MKNEKKKQQPYKIHLPGFLVEKEIGLGDVVKRATSSLGIKACGGCDQRAAMLNNWFVITPKTNK